MQKEHLAVFKIPLPSEEDKSARLEKFPPSGGGARAV